MEDFESESCYKILQKAEQDLPYLKRYSKGKFIATLKEIQNSEIQNSPKSIELASFVYCHDLSLSDISISNIKTTQQLEWNFVFTSDFIKNVLKYNDKKLQGKILEAIIKITINPLEMKGDTQKRLTGRLSKYYRYRVGDYRIIYLPEVAKKIVYFFNVLPRGTVYE